MAWEETTYAKLYRTAHVALSSTSYPLRSVVVVVTAGRVLLVGRISSFYLKQVAQEAMRRVSGILSFENQLIVMKQPSNQPDHLFGCDRQ